MGILFFRWLPIFGVIWVGSIVLGSIIGGLHKTAEKIAGRDLLILENIGIYVIFQSCYGIIGGFVWLLLSKIKFVSEGGVVWGVLIGGIVGSFVFLLLMLDSDRGEFICIWKCGWVTMLIGIIIGLVAGLIVTKFRIFVGGIISLSCWIAGVLTVISVSSIRFSTIFMMPFFIFLFGHRKIICNSCLRYSFPLQSTYQTGIRYCEYCNQTLEKTKNYSKIIFTFGNYQIRREKLKFVLSNPDLEKKDSPMDVSGVYIDTKTADKLLIEKFITYIRNYPPKHGLGSIRIFYRGQLDDLGYLKNQILNNFRIERI